MSDNLIAAAKLAVTMLKTGAPEFNTDDVLEVLEAALAEPVQEPLTEVDILRKWLDLDATLPERSMGKPPLSKTLLEFVRAIERAHRIE
jgi:hypothetical protein